MRTKDIGSYGTNYTARAFTAIIGLGANIPEDAIYPTCEIDETGAPLDGSNKYVLHFDKSEIPAVKGFWSITLYDKDGFFTDNSINRYAIGDRDKLKYNNDGSLDVYIQHNSPGKDKEGNWLPAPSGIFNLTMRLYWPEESVLSENWNPPVVKKI